MMEIMAILLFCMTVAVTVFSCVSDVRTMRIPNAHSVIILAAFAAAFALAPQLFGRWWEHVGAFTVMFAATFAMFSAGMLGSGDTKLGSALALWVGLRGLMIYLLFMTLAGGVLGIASLVLRGKKVFRDPQPESWMAKAQAGKSVVPYGVAISFGFWTALFHTAIFHHTLDEVFRIIH